MQKFFKSLPLLLLLTGCTFNSTSEKAAFSDRPWRPENAPRQVRLIFTSDDRIIGNSGVNTFFGPAKIAADGSVVLNRLGMTRKAGHPKHMAYENEFIKKLNATRYVRPQADKLLLLDAQQKVLLELVQGPAEELK